MKRNSVSKKILSLVMCLLMVVSIVPIGMISASAANGMGTWTFTIDSDTAGRILHDYDVPWKNGEVTEWKKNNDSNLHAIALHYVYNAKLDADVLAYCVVPGRKVVDGTETFTSFDDLTNATGNVLSNKQIETLVKLVVAYGTPTGTAKPSNYSEALYNAYATQLLIWEIVTGERNPDFSYNGDRRYALENISDERENIDYFPPIKAHYDAIAECVRANLKNSALEHETTKEETQIDLGTVELKLNTENFCYEGIFSNENITNCSISSLNTLPQSYLSIDHYNGALKVSIPIKEAFDYQQNTYDGILTKTEQSYGTPFSYLTINNMTSTFFRGGRYTVEIGGVNYVKDAQQMVVLIGSPNTENITPIIYEPYRLSFKIKVPEVHRHNWIPHKISPTCTTQGLMCWECSCGRVITSDYAFTSGTGHPVDYDFKTGIVPAEGHDSGVTVTTVAPTCSTKGETRTLCTKCGIVTGASELPELGHTKEGEGSVWVVSQEPTAEAKGEMSLLCGRCGTVQKTKEIEQHTHDSKGGEVVVTAPTCATVGMKGTLCSACGAVYNTETVPAGHSKKIVEVTNVSATCTKDGEATVLCTACGEILDTKVLPALGHTDDDVWYTAVEPTCTTDGEIRKLCTRCGEVTDAKASDALGHDEGVWTTTVEPTCELDGEQVLRCTRCGRAEDSRPIEKLGHDKGAWRIDMEATADHDGSMNLYCTRCGMVQDTKAFTQHTHEKGYTATLLQETCTRDGEQGTVCGICNAVFETETIKAAGHSYLAPYQNGNGTHSMKCENCSYVYTENCSLVTTDYANSCTTIGYRVHVCTLCGYNYTDGYTKAMGHDYAKWENYNASSHVRYCSRCPVAEYTLHVWSPYYFNGDETVLEPGTKTRTCIYCGTEHTIEGEDSGFAVAVNNTINGLEFSLKVLEFFNKIIAGVKKILSVIFDFIR